MRPSKTKHRPRYPQPDISVMYTKAIKLICDTGKPDSVSYSKFAQLMFALPPAKRTELLNHSPTEGCFGNLKQEVMRCYWIRANQNLLLETNLPILQTDKAKLLHIIKNMLDNGALFYKHDGLKDLKATWNNSALQRLLTGSVSLIEAIRHEQRMTERHRRLKTNKEKNKALEQALLKLISDASDEGVTLDPMQIGRIEYQLQKLEYHETATPDLFSAMRK